MRKKYPSGLSTKDGAGHSFPLAGNPLYLSLTPNQKRFVYNIFQKPITHWTNGRCYADAMGRPKATNSDNVEACRNLKKVKIQECIRLLKDAYSKSLHVTTERILEEESYIAYSDISEFFDKEDRLITNPTKLPEAARRAVSSFREKYDSRGNIYYEVALWSKGNSLKRLQSILGMNSPQQFSVNGKITHGGKVEHVMTVDLSILKDKEIKYLDTIARKLQTQEETKDETI